MRIQLITKAVLFANEAHAGQTRKYSGDPYITHPMGVAKIVSDFGGTLEQVVAAYLHDTVEDVERVTLKIIAANFGDEVAALVEGLTKSKYPEDITRADKKATEANRLASCNGDIQFIKCADIIHNSGTILQYDIVFGALYLQENLNVINMMKAAKDDLRNYALAVLEAEIAKLSVLQSD